MWRRSSPLAGALALPLTGCLGIAPDPLRSPAAPVDGAAVVGIEAVPSSGSVPHAVTIRAVNAWGAAVPWDPEPSDAPRSVSVDGVDTQVAFDGFGYGAVAIEAVGPATITLESGPVEAHGLAPWVEPPLHRAWVAPVPSASAAVAGATGGLAVDGVDVWWVGDRVAPHRVLTADLDIRGIRAVNLDVDGVLDALVWDTSTVYLLRGRPSGGMAWVGAWQAPGRDVAGADAGDVSGDNLPDVAIAWVDEGGQGLLDVLEGDGLLGFTAATPRATPGRPQSLVMADNSGEGVLQITVLHAEGDWSRFVLGATGDDGRGRYIPIGPRAPANAVVVPPDGVLEPTGDLNGDGAAEVALAQPRIDGQARDLWFFDVATDEVACAQGVAEAQCSTEFLALEQEPSSWVEVVDLNGDYRSDVLLQQDQRPALQGVLIGVAFDPFAVTDAYGRVRLLELPAYGPMAAADHDRDGAADLLLAAGPAWWRWRGRGFGDLTRLWEPAQTPAVTVRTDLPGPMVAVPAVGAPSAVELIAAGVEDGDTVLRAYAVPPGGPATQVAEVVVGDGSPVGDLAVCGTEVYVVVNGLLSRVVRAADDLTVSTQVDAAATRVACGDGPSGAGVVTLDFDGVQLRNGITLARVGAVLDGTGVVDVAIGNVGGQAQVGTCDTRDCAIEHWPIGADGVFAIGDPASLRVDDGSTLRTLGGAATVLSTGDLDGDGAVDLLGLDPARRLITVVRSDGVGPSHPSLFHTELDPIAALSVADGDADGLPDLWTLTAPDGDAVFVPTVPAPEPEATTASR